MATAEVADFDSLVAGEQTVTLPDGVRASELRLYGATHATPFGLSIFELRVLGDDGEFLDITGASASFEQSGNPAASAVDGDDGTRWGSNGSPEAHDWILIELGAEAEISAVEIVWEAAYASAFALEIPCGGSPEARQCPSPPAAPRRRPRRGGRRRRRRRRRRRCRGRR